ncbi:hypothetical protein WDW86_21700 [Bdellovibrionota bacterium FG-2]
MNKVITQTTNPTTNSTRCAPPEELPTLTVLVEELALTRKLWTEYFQEKGWPLEVFENPLDFLEQLDRFSNREERVHFFFDQDFGKIQGVGTQLARAVYSINRRQFVSLVTLHDDYCFRQEFHDFLLNAVFEKYPEVLFGPDYFHLRLKKEPTLWTEVGVRYDKPCALEKILNTNGQRLKFTLEEYFPSRAPKPELVPTPDPTPEIAQPKQLAVPVLKTPWWRRLLFLGRVEV